MRKRVRHCRGFTMVELLVVISIIALLAATLLPSLRSARRAAHRAACLSNMRSLALAQATYAATQNDALVIAGEGSYDVQGSWIGLLEQEAAHALVRRCPSDKSPYFDKLYTVYTPAVHRTTSYGINNFVSPAHTPLGAKPVKRMTDIRRASAVIQFVELAETGDYAVADHIHVPQFFSPFAPQSVPLKASVQMPIGRHGGKIKDWSGVLNYGFLDSHAESLSLRNVYEKPDRNLFDPSLEP